jgi:erythromycin esterase
MKKTIVLLLFCFSNSVFSQTFLNLDFEYAIQGTQKPLKWFTGGNGYIIALDNKEKVSLSKSLKIVSNIPKGNEFGVCTGYFPIDLVKGKNIEFTGRIKTNNITGGYAGLWWRVDGKNGTMGFDNMSDRGLKGTNDWKQVSIKMKVNEGVTNINFGCLFVGQGTAWFDKFEIMIDGKKFIDPKPITAKPTSKELTWLKKNIYPLKTYQPGSTSNEDLKILIKLIGDSKVVALGETTHGSSEIFKMKHRIIKYLSENDGFDIFSIEANMPESYKLNDYILEGKGNPTDLIKGMYFWTWRTQEVLDMVEWMRDHNKSEDKIYFTGFDMQFYFGAIQELSEAFNGQDKIQKIITELKTSLDNINNERNKSSQAVMTEENKKKPVNQLNSLRDFISKSNYPVSKKSWLSQNIRIIEQYIENASRDQYMAENLLWIKSQNPDSKIVVWAHNGHIQKTDNRMGKYLFDSLKNNYLTIGFTFHKGSYTAKGDKGLSTYQAQESYPGTYEYFFNEINEPIFILDLTEVKKQNSEYGKWLTEQLSFRSVGAMKTDNEFYETNLTSDFDLLIFIRESTNSKLLD